MMLAQRFLLRSLILASVLLCGTRAAQADHWSRFRGPNGTGVAEEQKVPAQWSENNILWKVPLPGAGNSSPVLWGERLFVQSASTDASQRFLLCLNANTGETLWKQAVGGSTTKTLHKKNSLASSTPAVDGQRVYVAFWDGAEVALAAYDFDGKPLWSKNLGGFKSQHGAGASPVVHGGKVFFTHDQDDKADLYALDAKTGDIVWHHERPEYRACYGSPFVWERAGQSELVVANSLAITGYNPDTGHVNWSWQWVHKGQRFPLRVTGSPTFIDDMVYVAAGDGGGARNMVALRVTGAYDKAKVEKVWDNSREFPYVPTMIAYKGHLYTVHDKGTASCFEAKTGKKIWSERLSGNVDYTASPVLAGGKIFIPSEAGEVFVLEANPAFQFAARNDLGERLRATPAVAHNHIYVRGQHHLFCIGAGEKK